MASNVIEKLNMNNYTIWASDMKYLMLDKGIWDIIEKKLKVPTLNMTVTTEIKNAFIVRKNQALSLIYLNI